MKPELTIVVCTRNRAFILGECLDSLFRQSASGDEYQVLVVDNSSTDGTAGLLRNYQKRYPPLRYVKCEKIGLSHARNLGWQESATPWVGYVDDDARVPYNYVEKALGIIFTGQFDCFGGTYYAWFRYGKPRWLPKDFGNKPILRTELGYINEGEHLSGGIFFCERSWLVQLDGFKAYLGMSDKIGYGEEDDLQQRLRLAGGRIGYDPGFYIDHCVLPHKLKLEWHLRSAYRHGLTTQLYNKRKSLPQLVYWLFRTTILGLFKRLPLSLKRSFVDQDIYWQNIVLETVELPLQYLGRVVGEMRGIGVSISRIFSR